MQGGQLEAGAEEAPEPRHQERQPSQQKPGKGLYSGKGRDTQGHWGTYWCGRSWWSPWKDSWWSWASWDDGWQWSGRPWQWDHAKADEPDVQQEDTAEDKESANAGQASNWSRRMASELADAADAGPETARFRRRYKYLPDGTPVAASSSNRCRMARNLKRQEKRAREAQNEEEETGFESEAADAPKEFADAPLFRPGTTPRKHKG